ncbi:MAG: alpha/beta fold hydrolase [Halofilum sp. (in: g-proteobacteria)]|nr:alpha/beta fold hydrolase [Halofilum sp. (in: g-proteobacteria)]
MLMLPLLAACAVPVPPLVPSVSPGDVARLVEDAWIAADGSALPLTRWLAEGEPAGVVLALHGFSEHGGVFFTLAPQLADAGYSVYAYDQRGFGATASRGFWPGADQLTADARSAWRLLRERYPQTPVHLLGHSMGAAIAVLATTGTHRVEPASTVLVSPAVHGWDTLPWIQRVALRVGHFVVPGAQARQRWARAFVDITVTDDPVIRRMQALDPAILRKVRIDMIHGVVELMDVAADRVSQVPTPLLIQYGERDDIIPTLAACALFERLHARPASGRWFALYPEGYHYLTRDLQRDRTIRDILDWLAAPGTAPHSGAGVSPEVASRHLCETAVDEPRAHPRP